MDGESSAVPSAPAINPQRGLVEYTYLIYALHALTVVSAFLTMRVPVLRFAFCLPSFAAIRMAPSVGPALTPRPPRSASRRRVIAHFIGTVCHLIAVRECVHRYTQRPRDLDDCRPTWEPAALLVVTHGRELQTGRPGELRLAQPDFSSKLFELLSE